MPENSIAIIGESRLARELAALCTEKGIAVALHRGANSISPSSPLVIESLAQNPENKRDLLAKLDAVLSPVSVILTSCLGSAVTYLAAIGLSVLFIYLLVIACALYPGKQAAAIYPADALHED